MGDLGLTAQGQPTANSTRETTHMDETAIRPAVANDREILWEFLAMAAYEPNAAAAKAVPMVATYLDGWQRPQDFGFIAELDGASIGAIWARQFEPAAEPGYYRQDRTPEMAIGVRQHMRGCGVGQMLLRAMLAEAVSRDLQLCLNVRLTNPALRLYERMGFRAVPGMTVRNRVGGLSVWMVWRASS
jgi:GNAT superfamily N-acetyltransferase